MSDAGGHRTLTGDREEEWTGMRPLRAAASPPPHVRWVHEAYAVAAARTRDAEAGPRRRRRARRDGALLQSRGRLGARCGEDERGDAAAAALARGDRLPLLTYFR